MKDTRALFKLYGIIAFIVIFGIASLISLMEVKQAVDKQAKMNYLYAQSVRANINEYTKVMELVSKGDITKDFNAEEPVSDEYRGMQEDQGQALRNRLRNIMAEYPYIFAIEVVDDKGMNLVIEPYETQKGLPLDAYKQGFSQRDWFIGANARKGVHVSEVYVNSANSEPTVSISAPVQFENGRKGVIAAGITLKNLSRLAYTYTTDDFGTSYIVDRKGQLVASPEKGAFSGGQVKDMSVEKGIADMIAGKVQNDFFSVYEKGNTHQRYHMQDTFLPEYGWYVVTDLYLDQLYPGILRIFLIAGLLFFFLVFSYVYSARNIQLRRTVHNQKLMNKILESDRIMTDLGDYMTGVMEEFAHLDIPFEMVFVDFTDGVLYGADAGGRGKYGRQLKKEELESLLNYMYQTDIVESDDRDMTKWTALEKVYNKDRIRKVITKALNMDMMIRGLLFFAAVTGSKASTVEDVSMIATTIRAIEDSIKRRIGEHEIQLERNRLLITLKSIGDGVIVTDTGSNVAMMNEAAEALTGWTQNEAAGKRLDEVFRIFSELTGEKVVNPVERVLMTSKIVELSNHTGLLSRDGKQYAIADSAAPIMDENGLVYGVVLVFRDVTEKRKKDGEIIYLSQHDGLTGLYNRNFFNHSILQYDCREKLPLSVIMGDVNGLKLINDVFGHWAGDGVLVKIAELFKNACEDGAVFRWGGDEFLVLLPGIDEREALRRCESITSKCEEFSKQEKNLVLSISLGCATKKTEDVMLKDVIKQAEDYMYRSKLLESRSLHNTIIASIRNTLIEKDLETEEHVERLRKLSIKIGKEIGLPEKTINELGLFALLHDIGKIAVDERILSKPESLTEGEWNQMKRHSEIGYRMAQASPELSYIAEYILCHHERWDGTGYPQGLKGEDIPLLSRILAVVDAYDAMTNDRVYRKKMSEEEAKQEILKNSGTQFDPEIVKIILEKV